MTRFGYLGGVGEGQMVLRALLEAGWRPEVIVSLEDTLLQEASGGVPWREDDWAGIPVVKVGSFQSLRAVQVLVAGGCDGVLAVGISEILKQDFLELFPLGVFGFHGSLLPELAGPAPANWAILRGYRKTGTTLLRYTTDIDGGVVVGQVPISIEPEHTVAELYRELSRLSAELWLEAWPTVQQGAIAGKALGKVPTNPRRRPEDGLIRWASLDAVGLSRIVRALSHPYPGAYFWSEGRRVWVHQVRLEDGGATDKPVLSVANNRGLSIDLPGGQAVLNDLRDDEGDEIAPSSFAKWVGKPMDEMHRARRILAIVAHPDDEVLGVGGTLIRHFKQGDDVFVRIVCSGDPIRYPGSGERDQSEDAQLAAYFLGASTAGLGLPDQRLDEGSLLPLIRRIEEEVQNIRPEVVYTHFWGDVNADHVRIAEAVEIAARPYNAPFLDEVLAFETASSTEWTFTGRARPFCPTVYVDISEELDRKMDAMRAYRSELREFPHPRSIRSLRQRAALRGSAVGLSAAEVFQSLRRIEKPRPASEGT